MLEKMNVPTKAEVKYINGCVKKKYNIKVTIGKAKSNVTRLRGFAIRA